MKTSIIRRRRKLFVSLFILASYSSTAQVEDAQSIIRKYLDTVSNKDASAWSRLTSAEIQYISNYDQASFDGVATLAKQKPSQGIIYRVWPNKFRLDLYTDSVISSSSIKVDKKSIRKLGNLIIQDVAAGLYEPYFEFETVILQHLIEKKRKFVLKGTRKFDDATCYDLEVKAPELIWHFYINTKTFLLDYQNNSRDGSTENITKVFDYKLFNSLLIPTAEIKYNHGRIFFWSRITNIKFNEKISDDKFEME